MASLISRNDSVNRDCGASVMVQIGLPARTMLRDLGRSIDAGLDKARFDKRSPSVDCMAMDTEPFRIEVTGLARFIGIFSAGPKYAVVNFLQMLSDLTLGTTAMQAV